MVPRVVFDAMVFLQGAGRTTSPAAACLQLAANQDLRLFVSPDILEEIVGILGRARVRTRFPILTDQLVDSFVERVRSISETVSAVPTAFFYPRDPNDEPYFNLAIAIQADFLVSRDKDLLDLEQSANPERDTAAGNPLRNSDSDARIVA